MAPISYDGLSMTKESSKVARTLGIGYAYVQHAMDKTIVWGLKHMQETTKDKPFEPMDEVPKTYLSHTKSFLKGTVHFVGELGSTYFEKYEELKSKDKSQKK